MKLILIILMVVCFILQYRLWFADAGLLQVMHLKQMIKKTHAEKDEIIKYNDYLTKEISALKKGGAAIENKARSELGMVKKGEIFYQIVK